MRPFDCIEKSPPPGKMAVDAPAKWQEAQYYQPDPELVTALQIAIAMHQPLLITGDPGCGKTSAAYWTGWRLGLRPEDLIHVQVRSDSSAARLKYDFDAVRYFRESQVAALSGKTFEEDRERFIQKGYLWLAFDAANVRPTILLLDEIDKAPRDFPNDLLRELDTLEFEVADWPVNGKPRMVNGRRGPEAGLTLTVITSNGERQLPDAFLRRCLHHHLRFDAGWLAAVVKYRMQQGDLVIAPGLVEHAIKRFIVLQNVPGLRHRPGLSEFLVWLRILALTHNVTEEELASLQPGKLPYLGALLKDPSDRTLVTRQLE